MFEDDAKVLRENINDQDCNNLKRRTRSASITYMVEVQSNTMPGDKDGTQ